LFFSTLHTRLAIGTNDQILTAASGETTGMKWAAAAAGGVALDNDKSTGAVTSGFRSWSPATPTAGDWTDKRVIIYYYGTQDGGGSSSAGIRVTVETSKSFLFVANGDSQGWCAFWQDEGTNTTLRFHGMKDGTWTEGSVTSLSANFMAATLSNFDIEYRSESGSNAGGQCSVIVA